MIAIPGPSTNETIQQQSREKPDPSTTHEQNRAKPDPTIVQDPKTKPTSGMKRRRNPIVTIEPEILDDRVLPSCGVTEAEFAQWKPKLLEVERRALILEFDKVLASMRVMTPRRDVNQFLEWVVQRFDLFAWTEKPRTDVWKCLERCFKNTSSISRECGHEKTLTSRMFQGSNYYRIGGRIGQNIMPTIH